jgi:hypothetical protein
MHFLPLAHNIVWHTIHRNHLALSHTVYTVPLDWRVSSESRSFAFLMARTRTPTMVSLNDGVQGENLSFGDIVASARKSFSDRGELIERRFQTGFEESFCFEGTQQEVGYVVECFGSSGTRSLFSGDRDWVDRYYEIIKSARRINADPSTTP